jgi:sugar lactone lactonase YvrE
MIDRRSMLSAIISTALLPPSLAMITPAAAQGTNRAERLWTGFSSVVGMAFDKSGNLYAAEWSAGRISRVAPDGKRTTFASDLSGPSGLAIDAEGNIYVASYSRDEIYRFTPDGNRETCLR